MSLARVHERLLSRGSFMGRTALDTEGLWDQLGLQNYVAGSFPAIEVIAAGDMINNGNGLESPNVAHQEGDVFILFATSDTGDLDEFTVSRGLTALYDNNQTDPAAYIGYIKASSSGTTFFGGEGGNSNTSGVYVVIRNADIDNVIVGTESSGASSFYDFNALEGVFPGSFVAASGHLDDDRVFTDRALWGDFTHTHQNDDDNEGGSFASSTSMWYYIDESWDFVTKQISGTITVASGSSIDNGGSDNWYTNMVAVPPLGIKQEPVPELVAFGGVTNDSDGFDLTVSGFIQSRDSVVLIMSSDNTDLTVPTGWSSIYRENTDAPNHAAIWTATETATGEVTLAYPNGDDISGVYYHLRDYAVNAAALGAPQGSNGSDFSFPSLTVEDGSFILLAGHIDDDNPSTIVETPSGYTNGHANPAWGNNSGTMTWHIDGYVGTFVNSESVNSNANDQLEAATLGFPAGFPVAGGASQIVTSANAQGGTANFDFSADAQAGDVVVLFGVLDTGSMSSPSGFTSISVDNGDDPCHGIWYKDVSVPADANFAVSVAGDSRSACAALLCRGVTSTGIRSQVATGSGSSYNWTGLTGMTEGGISILAGFLDDDNVTASATITDYTLYEAQHSTQSSGNTAALAIWAAANIASTIGTSASASNAGNDAWHAVNVELLPS